MEEKRQQLGQRTAEVSNVFNQYNPATDPTINALRGNQSEKLKELFSHDQQLADVNFQPQAAPAGTGEVVAQPEQRLVDPTIGMRASSQQTMATAGEIGNIISQIGQRKDYLSSERDKALSVLDRMLAINDRETRMLEKQFDVAIQDKKDKMSNVLSILGLTGGVIPDEIADSLGLARGTKIPSELERRVPSQSERAESAAVSRLRSDIDSGTRFDDLIMRYSSELPISKIRQEYNQGPMAKRWGPAKETDEYLLERISGAKKGPSKQQLANTEMANIVNTLNNYAEKRKQLGVRAFNPYDPLTSEVGAQKDLFSQLLGKYIEVGGRGLTDKDREFYARQIPGAIYMTGSAEGKIRGVKNSILSKAGFYEVKDKRTGQIGIIPKEEFDENRYIKLAP